MGADATVSVRGRHLVFRLAAQSYALPVAAIDEIVPMAELAHAAGAPEFLAGFLDLGGDLIAVISMRRLFRLAGKPRELFTPIIILRSTGQRIALEVDSVNAIGDFKDADAVVLGEKSALGEFACAVARINDESVFVLSPERLLLEQERRRLAELADRTRDRLAALEAPVS